MSTPQVKGINDRPAQAREAFKEQTSQTADKAAAAVLSLEAMSQMITTLQDRLSKMEDQLAKLPASADKTDSPQPASSSESEAESHGQPPAETSN